jgi:serine O-acetyltransferase
MRCSLSIADLENYVSRLLANHLPDGDTPGYPLRPLIGRTLERLEHCFSRIHRKYYEDDGVTLFDHLNSDHAAAFLYLLGNTAWHDIGDERLPTKLFYLNKIMHGLDLYFSVPMPEIFLLVHPVGTVLGKASYSDFLVVYQNCTVGADIDVYPRFGEGIILYSSSSVIGDCAVGDNVVFGANSMIVSIAVPNDTVVLGQYPEHRFVPNTTPVQDRVFSPVDRPKP